MLQQIIALIIILGIITRLVILKTKNKIAGVEFFVWLFFWIFAGVIIISLKFIDVLVSGLGFSGTGIEVILYLSVVVLFYLNFRLRIRLEKIDRNMTKVVRSIAINEREVKK